MRLFSGYSSPSRVPTPLPWNRTHCFLSHFR